MRKVYRNKSNDSYWEDRWSKAGVDENTFENLDIYPIKYAEKVAYHGLRILEAGCGAGRLYFHYKQQGKDIYGIDFAHSAINNILAKDTNAQVVQGSVTDMPYENDFFDSVMAFGLFHNFEDDQLLDESFKETARVIKPGGKLVMSVRFDSFENNIIESIVKSRGKGQAWDKFHRLHFSLNDLQTFLNKNGMDIEEKVYARNVSFLFKYDFFRFKAMKSDQFKESDARSLGFQLNGLGTLLDRVLHGLLPRLFSNLIVVVAKKR